MTTEPPWQSDVWRRTEAEQRPLIAEGRKHDEAMTDGPWTSTYDIRRVDVNGPLGIVCRVNVEDDDATDGEHLNAAGIAWFGTHRHGLLDGYERALDEVDRLRTELGEAKLVIEQQDRDMERMRVGITDFRDRHGDDNHDYRAQLDAILEGKCTDTTTTK